MLGGFFRLVALRLVIGYWLARMVGLGVGWLVGLGWLVGWGMVLVGLGVGSKGYISDFIFPLVFGFWFLLVFWFWFCFFWFLEAARDLMSEMLNQEGGPTFRVIRGGKTDGDDAPS